MVELPAGVTFHVLRFQDGYEVRHWGSPIGDIVRTDNGTQWAVYTLAGAALGRASTRTTAAVWLTETATAMATGAPRQIQPRLSDSH